MPNGSNINQSESAPSIWKILITIILFFIVGYAWVWSTATLLDNLALYNMQQSNPFYARQYMASVSLQDDTASISQIVLNHLSINGLLSTALTIIEWKIGEKLLAWFQLLLKKPIKKALRFCKRVLK